MAGLNHVTFAVSDLDASILFYTKVLEFKPLCKWSNGAYLQAGGIWIALNLDLKIKTRSVFDYTHIAFTVTEAEFPYFSNKIKTLKIKEWHQNKSEGQSIYFLDPDGHQLELHVGDLNSRINQLKSVEGIEWFHVE